MGQMQREGKWRKPKESQQMTANQGVPTDRRGGESREGSERGVYPLVQAQLPRNWDQQSDEGGMLAPRKAASSAQPGSLRDSTLPLPPTQTPRAAEPTSPSALGCTEKSPALAGTRAGWAHLCQIPVGAQGREAKLFLQL